MLLEEFVKLIYKWYGRVGGPCMHEYRIAQDWSRAYANTLALLLAGTLLGACAGGSVAVPTSFPVPLMEKVQLPVGIYLDDALSTYSHTEAIEGRGEWHIELGSAQRSMFDNLLAGMFIGHRFVQRADVPNPDVAGVIIPSIDELQFTLPSQTRTDYHEVWIRYRFQMLDNQGHALGDWFLTAYGKSHKQNHGGASASLQAAALEACRDAMADFALRFKSFPGVAGWLQSELDGAS